MNNPSTASSRPGVATIEPVTDRSGLSTNKWELEFERLGRSSVISMGTADMDFRSPRPVIEALAHAVTRGHFGYAYRPQSYFDAVTGYFERRFGWRVEREWIDSATSIYAAMPPLFAELTAPGDEIVYQPPVHAVFEEVIRINDRIPLANPLKKVGDQYRMDLEHLVSIISDNTTMLLLCNPHNPVGRAWDRKELAALHDICASKGIVVIADEVYSGLVYPGMDFVPIASISLAASLNTITLTGASKSFNVTGLKHALVIAENPEHRQAYARGARRASVPYGVSLFGQLATEVAFRECDDWSRELMAVIAKNFQMTREFLHANIPAATVSTPDATYFAWIDFSFMSLAPLDLVSIFENEANVVMASGHVLGHGGEGHVRLNLGCTKEVLLEGLDRIAKAVSAHAARAGTQGIS